METQQKVCSHEQFTEQQIEDFCRKVETLCIGFRDEGKLCLEAVQIIRQQQARTGKGHNHSE